VANSTPLAATIPNLAHEVAAAGYRAALFGYTDTPLDPALEGRGEAWICPGFEAIAPFLFGDDLADWSAWLRQRGYTPPADARRMLGARGRRADHLLRGRAQRHRVAGRGRHGAHRRDGRDPVVRPFLLSQAAPADGGAGTV
jgi:hypothetical protein